VSPCYRATTDPREDPESHYLLWRPGVSAATRRMLAALQAPLLGRLIVGPPSVIASFIVAQAGRMRREPISTLGDWIPHLAGVGLILLWLAHCHLGIGTYLLSFIYPGCALGLLRSFAEHRAALLPAAAWPSSSAPDLSRCSISIIICTPSTMRPQACLGIVFRPFIAGTETTYSWLKAI
jgi:hypothetical protein